MPIGGPFRRRLTTSTLGVDYFWTPIMAYFSAPIDIAEVVDQLRRSLALEYLKESNFTTAQIAWLLGYESSTSFNHAFRRWTSRSPSASRKKERRPARSET